MHEGWNPPPDFGSLHIGCEVKYVHNSPGTLSKVTPRTMAVVILSHIVLPISLSKVRDISWTVMKDFLDPLSLEDQQS